MSHWADNYIGRPYISKEYDCASLVTDVLREQFGKEVPDYGERPSMRSAEQEKLKREVLARATRVEVPTEGCAVQIMCSQRIGHIGVYCVVDGWPSVLHSIRKHGALVTKVRDMAQFGWIIEGYYEWN